MYQISRWWLARLAAEEYVRHFWWILFAPSLFGIVALIFGRGVLQVVGAMGLLWPFTIPSRAILNTGRTSRLLMQGVWVLLEDEVLYFHGQEDQGFKLSLDTVARVRVSHGYALLRLRARRSAKTPALRLAEFVPIPLNAMDEPFQRRLFAAIEAGN